MVITQTVSYKSPMITFDLAVPLVSSQNYQLPFLIIIFLQNKVTLWWPNGYGDQKLYPLHFTVKTWWNKDKSNLRDKTTSQKSIRIGFRTIELVEEPVFEGEYTYI